MTTPPTAEAADPTALDPTALDPTVRARLRALRRPALVVVLLVLTAVGLAALRAGASRGHLDPDAATPQGARALRVLLEEQGVTVTRVRSSADAVASAGAGRTLLVAESRLLSGDQVQALGAVAADLVLVEPTPALLAAVAPQVSVHEPIEPRALDPGCELRAATRAGRAEVGGLTFAVTGPAERCYSGAGRPSLVRTTTAGAERAVTALGSGQALTNDRLAREGNAALALNLLGGRDHLVWYLPVPELAPAGEGASARELLPPWVGLVVVQLAVVVLLLAVWRGRRLGPVVTEPLPVLVRAAETTEGRARLYRAAGARDRAAAALRAASRERVRPAVGLARTAEPGAVVEVVAARTGRPPTDVAALLYGAAPPDDAALVRLADDLDDLERLVRRR